MARRLSGHLKASEVFTHALYDLEVGFSSLLLLLASLMKLPLCLRDFVLLDACHTPELGKLGPLCVRFCSSLHRKGLLYSQPRPEGKDAVSVHIKVVRINAKSTHEGQACFIL